MDSGTFAASRANPQLVEGVGQAGGEDRLRDGVGVADQVQVQLSGIGQHPHAQGDVALDDAPERMLDLKGFRLEVTV
jgi:hypothetical protein